MRTAVITIVAGRHDHLVRQRAALDGAEHHVVVAMGEGEAGHCRRLVGGTSDVIAIETQPKGLPLARARNAGARRAVSAGADLLVFLDVDCIPGAALLERYEAAADSTPALLCGPVAYLPPAPPDGYPAACLHSLATPHPARPVPLEDEVQHGGDHALFWTLSFAVTAMTWQRIGGFCEDYVGYGGEDTDFGQLAKRAGVVLSWVGGAWAYHQHHTTETPPVRHLTDILRNAALFHRRWGWWPMSGWLDEFANRGLARHDPAADQWVIDEDDSVSGASEGLVDLAEEFRDELGRAPTSGELLKLMSWAIKGLPDELIEGSEPGWLTGLRPRYRRGVKPTNAETSQVDELNDAPWNAAAEFAANLAREHPEPPSLERLLDALLQCIHEAPLTLLSDVEPADVIAIKPQLRRGQRRPRIGDVVAIPAQDGSFYRASVIARNRFGTAVGVYVDKGPARPPGPGSRPLPVEYAFYTDENEIVAGRWPIVGHDDDLLDLFPSEPECLYRGKDPVFDSGEHGLAETPDGDIRYLTADEAPALGLDRDDFRQSILSSYFAEWLDQRFG